jgi:hypothetical protein
MDGNHPETIDFREAGLRSGLATQARHEVDLQEIRRVCGSGRGSRSEKPMEKLVIKATILISAVVGSTATLFVVSWSGLALLGF